MNRYSSQDLATLLNVSQESIRKWCIEFEAHLSPTANPGAGRTRYVTEEDIKVLSYIAERRAKGAGYSIVHSELENGQRGILPDMSLVRQTASQNPSEQLQLANQENEILREQLLDYRQRLEELQKLRDESIRWQVQLEMAQSRMEKAENTIQGLLDERRELDREIARLRVLLEQIPKGDPKT
jgi:transposase